MKRAICIEPIEDEITGNSLLASLCEQHRHEIRYCAFLYFENRGYATGNDWEDWLRAERRVLWTPSAEMFENHAVVVLRVAVPGFGPESIRVTAMPQALLVQGTETHEHGALESRIHFCEFGQKLFRRFDLPTRIDPRSVSASLDKGILEIVASRQRRTSPSPVPASVD